MIKKFNIFNEESGLDYDIELEIEAPMLIVNIKKTSRGYTLKNKLK